MSLSRFTTRVLAVSALLPQPGDGDVVTMAGEQVFDSRLDPLQFNEDDDDIPAIVVYTDEDQSSLLNRAGAGGPYRRMVGLRVEITLATMADVKDPDGVTRRAPVLPSTDAELEAQLDLFEMQVRWALFALPGRNATTAFTSWVVRIHSITSTPKRDAENNRLASRRLEFELEVPDDCPPLAYVPAPSTSTASPPLSAVDAIVAPTTTGQPGTITIGGCNPVTSFVTNQAPGYVPVTRAMFPQAPWLADMFVAMQNAPSLRAVMNTLARTGQPAVILPALRRWRASFGVGSDPEFGVPSNPLNNIQTQQDI